MNDAQAWTSIGGLLAVLIGFLGLMVRMFGMTLDGKLEALEAGIDSRMEAGFARLELRIDGLDRDVSTLARRFLDGH
jgi:hypothetical protein